VTRGRFSLTRSADLLIGYGRKIAEKGVFYTIFGQKYGFIREMSYKSIKTFSAENFYINAVNLRIKTGAGYSSARLN